MSERITEIKITHLPENEVSGRNVDHPFFDHFFQPVNGHRHIRAEDLEGIFVSSGKAPKRVAIRHFNCRCAPLGFSTVGVAGPPGRNQLVAFTMWLCLGLFGLLLIYHDPQYLTKTDV